MRTKILAIGASLGLLLAAWFTPIGQRGFVSMLSAAVPPSCGGCVNADFRDQNGNGRLCMLCGDAYYCVSAGGYEKFLNVFGDCWWNPGGDCNPTVWALTQDMICNCRSMALVELVSNPSDCTGGGGGGGSCTGICQWAWYSVDNIDVWYLYNSNCSPMSSGCGCSVPPSRNGYYSYEMVDTPCGGGVEPPPGPCDANGGDADNDGCCADVDCNDNDATKCLPASCNPPGPCVEHGGDADADACCADVDCDDNDPAKCLPASCQTVPTCGGPCVWKWTQKTSGNDPPSCPENSSSSWQWTATRWYQLTTSCPSGCIPNEPTDDGIEGEIVQTAGCTPDPDYHGNNGEWVKQSGNCSTGCDCEEPPRKGLQFDDLYETNCEKSDKGCKCKFGLEEGRKKIGDKFQEWGFLFPKNDEDLPCFTFSLRMPGSESDTTYSICLAYPRRTEWWAIAFETIRVGLREILRALIWWKFFCMILDHLSGG